MGMLILRFRGGTLELSEESAGCAGPALPDGCVLPEGWAWDARTGCHRAPAQGYADLMRVLVRSGIEHRDEARVYGVLERGARIVREPRPYQQEAMDAWEQGRGAGLIVLPTGAGKSHVGVMAIERKRRDTLVVAPTLDLVRQWYDLLRSFFDLPVGIVGGGEHDVQPLTVTTYDSAYLQMEHLGARFGLVIFDECHHLPGETYSLAARQSLAPFRLGLSATPERSDGRETMLDTLIGPELYRRDIVEMSGSYLADYDVQRVAVELSESERAEYESERAIYVAFLRSAGINMGSRRGWTDFIMRSARTAEGRRAMGAYRRQRQLSFAAPAKLDYVEQLLHQHRHDRCILFTQDNATAYGLSRRFLVPTITHQTKVSERSEILEGLREDRYQAVVTSKVLNEGVDVPSANVAVVVSGSGSVREHVQRLGRVLRKHGDGRAVLYELITAATGEAYTSERRREHSAYQGRGSDAMVLSEERPAVVEEASVEEASVEEASVEEASVEQASVEEAENLGGRSGSPAQEGSLDGAEDSRGSGAAT